MRAGPAMRMGRLASGVLVVGSGAGLAVLAVKRLAELALGLVRGRVAAPLRIGHTGQPSQGALPPSPHFTSISVMTESDALRPSGSSRISGDSLEGVSATTLWTLHNRGTEAKRPDSVIRDPLAAELFDAIEYDYRKFGRPSQTHALRALAFDTQARVYLATHPTAAIVALAEGMQTSFWRLGGADATAQFTWYSVDLPPVMELRNQLLPNDERIVKLAQSALDLSWMDQVDASGGAFITAEGLLMYLQPEESLGLIEACAKRFPGGQMMFDSIPHWFSRRTLQGFKLSDRYVAPPMPFALTPDEGEALISIPGVVTAIDIPLHRGRGIWKFVNSKRLDRGFLRRTRPSMTLLQFG
ncbi:O-methyltransferase OMT [Mycobacteroides abscessus subsp. massiliense]|nr:O-methyltransferase OMT [Mycobacteroides abscessus subsp. massiliense]